MQHMTPQQTLDFVKDRHPVASCCFCTQEHSALAIAVSLVCCQPPSQNQTQLSWSDLIQHVLVQDMTLQQALDFVRERHPVASPNAGFLQRLVSLDTELHGASSVKVGLGSCYHLQCLKLVLRGQRILWPV